MSRAETSAAADPIGPNVEILGRTRELVSRLTEAQYRHVEAPLTASSIGQHVRHVLDHYRLFLDGLEGGEVDYDARRRRTAVESSPAAALEQIDALAAGLRELPPAVLGRALRVRQQGAYEAGRFDACGSRADRELMFLQSHTVHHQALIAVLARAQGVEVPSGFGVAPSTVAWQARDAAGGEAAGRD